MLEHPVEVRLGFGGPTDALLQASERDADGGLGLDVAGLRHLPAQALERFHVLRDVGLLLVLGARGLDVQGGAPHPPPHPFLGVGEPHDDLVEERSLPLPVAQPGHEQEPLLGELVRRRLDEGLGVERGRRRELEPFDVEPGELRAGTRGRRRRGAGS